MSRVNIISNVNMINNHELYFNAYLNTLRDYKKACDENPEQDFKAIIKKLIVYGVKVVNTKEEPEYIDMETAENDFQFASVIKTLMGILTPKEFMRLYLIAKEYKGHKYGMKDYFYTRDYVKALDQDKPIGEEILNFLWEYHNWELTDFNVETMHTDQKGTQFMVDNETGKTTKLCKPKTKHLKVIK